MSRRLQTPSASLHKASGQAVVRIEGHDVYLGRHGSPEAELEYQRVIAEWQASRAQPRRGQAALPSILELTDAYWAFAKDYYVKNGSPTGEQPIIRVALKTLNKLYADTPPDEFGALALKAVRETMIGNGWSRGYVNALVDRIRRMFKWAESNELVAKGTHEHLKTVDGLKAGRSRARETEPVRPVADDQVEAIRPFVSRQVWAMIELQRLTGMRPHEAVMMRTCDVQTPADGIWEYKVAHPKTEHHAKDRIVAIGPRARAILRPWLRPDTTEYLFSPAEAEAERYAELHADRKTRLSCGNRPGTNRRRNPQHRPKDRYTVPSYARAIARACDQAFPPPKELIRRRAETQEEYLERLGDEGCTALKAWRKAHRGQDVALPKHLQRDRGESVKEFLERIGPEGIAARKAHRDRCRWSPNQLRHSFATAVRKSFGIEGARVALSHASAVTSEIYAERDQGAARAIAAQVG